MVKDSGHDFRETMQVILLELKLKALNLFAKLKKESKKKNIGE